MPERLLARSAVVTTTVNGVENVVRQNYTVGQNQSISALNYGTAPKPGVWVCKPVTIRKSVCIGTPLPKQNVTISNVKYTAEGDVANLMINLRGFIYPWTYQPEPIWSDIRANESVNKAYAKIMSADLDVGVMVGELRETLEGIRNPLTGIRNFIKKKGGKTLRDNGRDFVSMLSSSWLEWRYGIRPLIQTIQDIYEHVNSKINDEFDGKMHRKRGRAPEVESRKRTTEMLQVGSFKFEMNTEEITSTRYSTSVGYKLTAPLTWEERYGLDIYSVPGIAWELTTLSFVVDWWLGIGNWLESLKTLNPKVAVQGISTSMKTVLAVESVTTGKALVNNSPVTLTGRSSAAYSYERLVRKCPSSAFIGVTPSINSKSFDLSRTVDGLTLLWQRIAKGR